jgi:hypothetical protein
MTLNRFRTIPSSPARGGRSRLIAVSVAIAVPLVAVMPAHAAAPAQQLATMAAVASVDPAPGMDLSNTRITSGSAPVGSSNYAVPANAIFVSPSGSDTAPGTLTKPVRSATRAIALAPSGSTIVVRQGQYHEGLAIPATKKLTIQSYPQESVWFDGSSRVQNWAPSGNVWVASGWSARFDASPTYTRGASDGATPNWTFVNPAHPMAAHPDQVWIDGKAVTQVQALYQVKPGTFYVDYAAKKLFLGSNPAGHSVRASDISKAATIQGAGSTLRGIGFQRFAPSIPDMGAITAEKDGVTIENVAVIDNAGTGIHAVGSNITFRNITLARNGMLGGSASTADNFKATGVLAYGNNTELFNQSPVSGGFKVTRSRNVRFSDSTFVRNSGPGLWLDESVYNGVITHNDSVANLGHGLSMEISAKFVVADNVITGNSGNGIKLNDTSSVDIWNNTLSGNARNLNIVQDARRASNRSTPGHDPRQAFPDPTMTWINSNITVRNNIVAGGSGNCLLCVEDYSHQFSAEQLKISANGNVYQRPSASNPAWAVVWSRGPGNPAVYNTLTAFRSATGQEASHLFLDGRPALSGWQPTSEVTAKDGSVAQPLSASIAGLIGKASGVRHLGAWAS